MLTIAVDATPIRQRPSGIGLYALNLIRALERLQAQENFQLSLVYQPSFKHWLKRNWRLPEVLDLGIDTHLLPLPVTLTTLLAKAPNNPLLSYLDRYLGQPDILQGTDHYVYPCCQAWKVMTIHDLTFLKYPQFVSSIVHTYGDRIRTCLRWTDQIITVSNSTKADIVECLDVSPERIFVTPLASRYAGYTLSPETQQSLKATINFDFSIPYLLFVSTLEPRKNVEGFIAAFNYLKQKHGIEHQLVLIGQKGWKYKAIFAAMEQSPWQHQIHHLDYLSDELVALFYTQAEVFVYPSYYEGFGLPILEAMTLGAPVVASPRSSLPEVAGDAALFADPDDPVELADAILSLIQDPQRRQSLIQQGKAQAQRFSWERTAQETLKAYRAMS